MTPEPTRYTVGWIGQASTDLERLTDWAETHGLQPLLLEVLRQLRMNLSSQPRIWGDPYINYRELHTVGFGRTLTFAGLRIEYVVHDTEPLVWLSSIRPLPGSPLAGSEGA